MVAERNVTCQMRGAVQLLSLARPPVNALSALMMADLSDQLRRAEADPAVAAVVLATEGAHFSVGLDALELGRVQGAALPGLCALVENLSKPVVAALVGNVLGGGLELALACHARVAHVGARLGLPEIGLGLLPVAGATQRLPRLVGAPVALNLLLDGIPMTAVEALAMGMLDAVVEETPLARAVTLAEELAVAAPRKTADRRDGMRDGLAYQLAITEARKRIERWRLPAPRAAVDCVEAAALLPFDMGLGFEQARAADMAETPEALGLRHAFLAEKRALFPGKELAAVATPRLSEVAILGTDGAASEVARMALAAGLKVRLIAADRARLGDALRKIAARLEALVAEGVLTAAAREADWARLTGVLAADGVGTDSLGAAELVLMASDAPPISEVTVPVIALAGRAALVLHPAPAAGGLAALCVTRGQPLGLLAAALGFGRRLGWRVLLQGPGAPLDQRLRHALARAIAELESRGLERQTIAAALAFYGLGAGAKVKAPETPEFADKILGFCLPALMNEAARMVSDGVALRPTDIDAAAVLTGVYPRWEGGPLYQADRAGAMAVRAQLRHLAEQDPQLFTPAPIFDRLIAEGRKFTDLPRD